MLCKIYPDNPDPRAVERAVEVLRGDGVIVYPTDGVYAFGCRLRSAKGLEKLRRLTGRKNADLTLVFDSLSRIADYARVDNRTFRLLKRNLPGPFTFVLGASSRVPDKALERRRTVGVRIPDNAVARALAAELGEPLATASVKDEDRVIEYTTDPSLIEEVYGTRVELVIDGGYGSNVPTTLVDLTGEEPLVLREGAGELI